MSKSRVSCLFTYYYSESDRPREPFWRARGFVFGAKLHEQSAHYLSKPNKCGSGLTKTALLPFILIR